MPNFTRKLDRLCSQVDWAFCRRVLSFSCFLKKAVPSTAMLASGAPYLGGLGLRSSGTKLI